MALHDNLKKIREEHNLTKKELCKKTKISERAYMTYEFGEREPKIGVLAKLADFYGVSTDYLMGRTTVKQMATEQPDPFANIDVSALEKRIIKKYTELDEDARALTIELFRQFSTVFNAEQQIADDTDVQLTINKPEIQQNTNTSPLVYCGTVGEELERRKREEEAICKDTA